MFQKLSNSWELVKESLRVLQADKELMIFPVISSIGVLIVSITFILPMIFAGAFDAIFARGGEVAGLIVVFAFYLVQYTVIFFANTALVGAAMIRLRGGDPTVSDGIRIASSRFGAILGYALISATVGMILRAIAQRGGVIGRIVTGLFGLAWSIATFLVVPVLAIENVGPIDAIKRSTNLLKRTWGEQIAGNLGIGAVFGLMALGLILIGGAAIVLAVSIESWALAIFIGCVAALAFVLLGLVHSALNGIYTAAVYQYATEGKTSALFSQQLVEGAFRVK
jgi:hypothetical protein